MTDPKYRASHALTRLPYALVKMAGPLVLAVVVLSGCGADEPAGGEPERQVGGAVSAVAVTGDQAWLGTGRRLQGVDVSDSELPQALGQSAPLQETIRGLAIVDDTVLAAAGTSGLVAFDVSDSQQPRVAETVSTAWAVNDVEVGGSRAYIAEGAKGMRILDVTDPTAIETLGSADTPGDALAVAVAGDTAYVADWGTGVRIIDLSDPSAPHEIGSIDTPGEAADVAVGTTGRAANGEAEGAAVGESADATIGAAGPATEILFVADRTGGLRVIDVSDPSLPTEMASVELPGAAERLAVEGDRAYVAAADGGVAAVDVSDPELPEVLGFLEDVTVAMDVAVEDGRVFAADVGAPVPQPRGAKADLWSGLHMWGVQGRPEVAEGLAGLHIADVSEDGLEPAGMFFSPSLIESVAVLADAELLYLADGHAGVLMLNASDPSAPVLVGSLETPGVSHDVVVDGDQLLVADGPAGLAVVDISEPGAPRLTNVVDTPGEALGIATGGEALGIATGGDGPPEGDGRAEPDSARLVYVADGESGLQVVDLASGSVVGAVDTPGMAWDVAVDRGYAFVSDRPGGMRVYDLADPLQPRAVAAVLDGQADVLDVVIDGDRAWVAAGPAGVHVFDVGDPAVPQSIGYLLTDDRAIGVLLDGKRAFVAAGDSGLLELDISDPGRLRQTGVWDMPGAAERLARLGDWVYVAAETGGLQLVPLSRSE